MRNCLRVTLRRMNEHRQEDCYWSGREGAEKKRKTITINVARNAGRQREREGPERKRVIVIYQLERMGYNRSPAPAARALHHTFTRQRSSFIFRDEASFPVTRLRQTIEGIPFNCSARSSSNRVHPSDPFHSASCSRRRSNCQTTSYLFPVGTTGAGACSLHADLAFRMRPGAELNGRTIIGTFPY